MSINRGYYGRIFETKKRCGNTFKYTNEARRIRTTLIN